MSKIAVDKATEKCKKKKQQRREELEVSRSVHYTPLPVECKCAVIAKNAVSIAWQLLTRRLTRSDRNRYNMTSKEM